jgi:hypothetical protein
MYDVLQLANTETIDNIEQACLDYSGLQINSSPAPNDSVS